jgi:hypothetical protein
MMEIWTHSREKEENTFWSPRQLFYTIFWSYNINMKHKTIDSLTDKIK